MQLYASPGSWEREERTKSRIHLVSHAPNPFGTCIRKPGLKEPGDGLCRSYSHRTQVRGISRTHSWRGRQRTYSVGQPSQGRHGLVVPCWETLATVNGPETQRVERWTERERDAWRDSGKVRGRERKRDRKTQRDTQTRGGGRRMGRERETKKSGEKM